MKYSVKFFLSILVVCILAKPTIAQNQLLIDSLQTELVKLDNDSNRVEYLEALAFEYRMHNIDSAFILAEQAIELSQKINYMPGVALGYNHLGILYKNKKNFSEAIKYHQMALLLRTKLGDTDGVVSSYNNLGLTYNLAGDYTNAIIYHLKALRDYEGENYLHGIGTSNNNIANIYIAKQEPKKALQFQLKAVDALEKSGDIFEAAKVARGIGFTYYSLNEYASALSYLRKALRMMQSVGDSYETIGINVIIGNILLETNHDAEAVLYLEHAMKTAQQDTADANNMTICSMSLAQAYAKVKRYPLAIKYAFDGIRYAKRLGGKEPLKDAYEVVAEVYTRSKNFEKALEYYRLFETVKDSLFEESNTQVVEELRTQYETEKKDLEITKKSLELDNAALEINKKRTQIILLFIAVFVIIIVSYLFYNRYRLKQKGILDEELLHQQELRNKAIVEAEEKERIRIAKDLHDGIGQQLSAVKMNLSAFEAELNLQELSQQDKMTNLLNLVDETVKEVRSISHNMMPNALLRNGLSSAVREFVNKISSTDMLKIDLQIVGLNERLEGTTEAVLYRVLQECVSNIIKHAQASEVSIQLIKHDTHLILMVEDNGKGFNSTEVNDISGIGLKNIVSRVHFLNGTVDFDSSIGNGTTIIINIPV